MLIHVQYEYIYVYMYVLFMYYLTIGKRDEKNELIYKESMEKVRPNLRGIHCSTGLVFFAMYSQHS